MNIKLRLRAAGKLNPQENSRLSAELAGLGRFQRFGWLFRQWIAGNAAEAAFKVHTLRLRKVKNEPSTVSDSNFVIAKRRRFYALSHTGYPPVPRTNVVSAAVACGGGQ